MLYGRLDANNNIAEIIKEDPTGRYPEEIIWVGIPDDFGLLSTKEKNALLGEIAIIQQKALDSEVETIRKTVNDYVKLKNVIDLEKEKLAAADVDVDAIWSAAQQAEAEAAAAAQAAEEAPAEEAPAEEAPAEEAAAEETPSA